MLLAAEWGTGQVLWSMMWFFLFVVWIWLLVKVATDVFFSRDLSGAAKAAWIFFICFLPYLGVFAYLLARGENMAARDVYEQRRRESLSREWPRESVEDRAPSMSSRSSA